MIKNPEIRDYPGLPSGPNVITKVFTRGRREGQRQRRKCDDGNRNLKMLCCWI